MSLGGLLGGGGSTGKTAGGFSDLPAPIRNAFSGLGTNIQGLLGNPTQAGQQYYSAIPFNADQTAAFNQICQGFTPDAQSIQSDLQMLQNPYQSSVIDEINRQAGGQFSTLNSALNESGQLGSNRTVLGANDVDLSRRNQIGTFLSDQYNKNLNTAINVLPQQRAADAQGLFGVGQQYQQQAQQNQMAPIQALLAASNALGVLPQSAGGQATNNSQTGALGSIGGLIGGAGKLFPGVGSFLGGLFG